MIPTLMIQRKLDCRSRKQKRKNQPITIPGLFFGLRLRLRQSSFHWIGVISGIGRNWNRSDSAYDSDFRFSLARSAYDSDYDSDSYSVASENQPEEIPGTSVLKSIHSQLSRKRTPSGRHTVKHGVDWIGLDL